ncbi:MAG: ribonuclease III [Oscillospiraceae bacterium]|nr:ribonuclease III [Oscillospiraceae bacterium]
MENYFKMNLSEKEINAISNLGLAHMGDCVFEILCRGYLCAKGGKNVGNLHRDTINMVKASSQAAFMDKLLPLLTEEELAYYRRGKNSHVHAVPKSCTPAEYAKATGLEALFGALYLAGKTERLNELFKTVIELSGFISAPKGPLV